MTARSRRGLVGPAAAASVSAPTAAAGLPHLGSGTTQRRHGWPQLARVCAGALLAVAPLAGCGDADSSEASETSSGAASGAVASALEQERPHNTLTETETAAGWKLLFDGVSTEGWRAYNGDAFPDTGWVVLNGALVVGATAQDPDVPIGGDLVTTEEFSSFDLRFEFKLSPVANSGVFFHVIEAEGHEIWHHAPEFQVLDDAAYLAMDDLGMDMEKHLTGDNYDLHASAVQALKPLGEWNQGQILVDGDRVEHWLNGQKTVEYELRSPEWEALVAASKFAPYPDYGRAESGPIGLQDHGRMVWYRNIKIRPL